MSPAGGIASTFRLSFGNVGGSVFFAGTVSGSAVVTPQLFLAQADSYDRSIFFTAKVGATDGLTVNLQGFELP